MSKEKQIEEMARELNTATFGVNVHTLADHLKPETINKVAEYLYNAGYRKQKEDAVEVVRCKDCKFNVANMEKDPLDITDYSGDDIVCSYFMTDGLEPADFCSYGAKMKGGEDNA
jgi:hypothetical protein